MITAAVAGIVAAVIAVLPTAIQSWLDSGSPDFPAHHASWILGITAAAFLVQRFVLDRQMGNRVYDGIADLFLHIHIPAKPDPPLRWFLRGCVSFLLAVFGGRVGPEGGAIEVTHALLIRLRRRSARWFEQRRRTDAAVAVGAGVSAAFGAPVAGTLLGLELGLGGRTLTVMGASAVAFCAAEVLHRVWGLPVVRPDEAAEWANRFWSFSTVASWIALTAVCGVFSAAWVRFYRYSQESLLDLFQTQAWMRVLTGGTLLFLIAVVSPQGIQPPWKILQELLWQGRSQEQALLGAATQALSLALVLSGFGTLGLFWLLFVLGGLLGTAFGAGLGIPAVLIGGAAVLGGVLGTPLTAGVLVFEMVPGEVSLRAGIAILAYLSAFCSKSIRVWSRTESLGESDLRSRGLVLREGRNTTILENLTVRDAMVSDFELIHEQQPASDLQTRLLKSKYPFFPVIKASGVFAGFLTADMIQEALKRRSSMASSSPLSKLVEVKDILYQSGFKTPTVKVQDRLSATVGIFDDLPCVPVVADDGRVQGLLFSHQVRLAYEREVARRSLSWERPQD